MASECAAATAASASAGSAVKVSVISHPAGRPFALSRDALQSVSERSPIRCVGAVITRPDGQLLLIKRGNEPGRGLWSLPGGRIEPGESDVAAVAREVQEETGLTVRVGRLAGRVQRGRYDIADYFATVICGQLAAATDALDATWADPRELATTPGLIDALASWGVTFGGPAAPTS